MSKPAMQPALNSRAGGGAARALRPQRMWGGKAPAQRRGLLAPSAQASLRACSHRLRPLRAPYFHLCLPRTLQARAAATMAPCSALAAPARAGAIAHQRAARPSGSSRSRRCVQVRAEGGSGGDDLAKQFEAFKRQMKAQVDSNPNVSTAAPPRCAPCRRRRRSHVARLPPSRRHPTTGPRLARAAYWHAHRPCSTAQLAHLHPDACRCAICRTARSPSRRRSRCRPANPSPLPLTPRPRGCRRFSQQQRGGWNDGATADKVRRTEARVLNAWTSERGMQAAAAGTVLLVVALLVAAGGPPADARCTLPWC